MHSWNINHCIKSGLKRNVKFIKYRENKLTVTRYLPNAHHWHEHKHASVLAIDQLCHQSPTAPSLAMRAADAVQLINVMNMTVTSYLRHM